MALGSGLQGLRLNVGCGATPTPGWLNFDNSLTVRLARLPGVLDGLCMAGLLSGDQLRFGRVARQYGVRWANAVQRIPLPDQSVEVVYASHMIEHLDREYEVPAFLGNLQRVLVADGIVRFAVPDLLRRARRYVEETRDADEFVASLSMADETPRGVFALARDLAVGVRNHRWMYDGASLVRLLERNGFSQARELPPGETMIPDPGPLNLRERDEESVYVEARRA
jgi:predicted SAM-dependent methyltransferase